MRTLFMLTFVANVVVTLISLAVLPARVAIHYGADGMANGWASNHVNALLMTGTHVVLFCSLYFSHRLVLMFPSKWVNLPNKEYWLSAENKLQASARIQGFMWRFGIAIFLFLLVVEVLSLWANLAEPARLDQRVFLPAMGVFMVYTICWAVGFRRAFRIPSGASAPKRSAGR
jgi:uncharacterized membrane protein